mgnify:CR=1 FL=1
MPKRENIPNQVYKSLKEDILFMRIKPGEAVGEIETAERFNVSRTPVRDAIRRLESDGLLEVKPHIGTYVSLIDLDQITDVMFMREQIEKAIMKDLAQHGKQTDFLKLGSQLKIQKELMESNSSGRELAAEFIKLDNEFHRTMFVLDGRGNVWDYLQGIEYHYDRYRIFLNEDDQEKLQRIYNEHVQLFELIQENNIDKAFEVYNGHLYYGIQHGTEKVLQNKQYFSNLD